MTTFATNFVSCLAVNVNVSVLVLGCRLTIDASIHMLQIFPICIVFYIFWVSVQKYTANILVFCYTDSQSIHSPCLSDLKFSTTPRKQ